VAVLSDALLRAQRADLPQADELSGPFWVATALTACGLFTTQEEAAAAAGSVLSPPGTPLRLPPGEDGRRPRAALPVAAPGTPAGTSVQGLARAVEELSGGRLAAVPATGDWTAANLLEVLDRVHDAVVVLADVVTGELWDPSVGDERIERYLATGADNGPGDAWRSAHVVAVGGARAAGRLLVLAEGYASRATHLQPVARVVAALRRGRRPGGLLVLTEHPGPTRAQVTAAGLRPAFWDDERPG
jgi:uncharacterized protein DUF6885